MKETKLDAYEKDLEANYNKMPSSNNKKVLEDSLQAALSGT